MQLKSNEYQIKFETVQIPFSSSGYPTPWGRIKIIGATRRENWTGVAIAP